MRWPAGMASLVVGAGIALAPAAGARPVPRDTRPDTPPATSDTWLDLLDPHAAEVEALLTHARQALRTLTDEVLPSDAEWAVDARLRNVRDARALMRHARSLSPAQPEVLELLGRAADELGDTAEALDALTAHVRVRGPERASPDVLGRLGALHLRTGQADAALRYLRLAQRPLRAETAPARVHLATALTTRGEIAAAIDTLRGVMPAQPPSFYSHELTLVAFSALRPGPALRGAGPGRRGSRRVGAVRRQRRPAVARALAHIHDLDRRRPDAARPAASPPARIRRTVAP